MLKGLNYGKNDVGLGCCFNLDTTYWELVGSGKIVSLN